MKQVVAALVLSLVLVACGAVDESGVDTPVPTPVSVTDDAGGSRTTVLETPDPDPGTRAPGTTAGEPQEDENEAVGRQPDTEDPNSPKTDESAEQTEETPQSREDRRSTAPSKLPDRVPPNELAGVVGEVPDQMMADIMSHAAEHVGTPATDFTVARAESVVWSDGSLGCPEPGVFYTQATIKGYWVVIEYQGTLYDYRATSDGHYRLCGSPAIGPPSS